MTKDIKYPKYHCKCPCPKCIAMIPLFKGSNASESTLCVCSWSMSCDNPKCDKSMTLWVHLNKIECEHCGYLETWEDIKPKIKIDDLILKQLKQMKKENKNMTNEEKLIDQLNKILDDDRLCIADIQKYLYLIFLLERKNKTIDDVEKYLEKQTYDNVTGAGLYIIREIKEEKKEEKPSPIDALWRQYG